MRNKLIFLFNVIVILNSVPFYGQQPPDEPLLSVLEKLQERFEVQFNYASDLVEGFQVKSPESNQGLQEVIASLQEQTQLEFVFISDTVVSIKGPRQRLCGFILDMETREPLPNCTIQTSGQATVSNEDGYFELPMMSNSTVVLIRHLGHRTLQREVRFFNSDECSVVYLVPVEQLIPEIVLSHYLIQGIDKVDDGSFQLDFDKFSILPGLVEEDVLQSVQALPGIQSIDETVSNINIRGGSNDQNLILWDDIKMYQSGHFFGLISMYNPQITQKVALQKNGSSATQTDGVSGTIAMSTDKNINPDIKGSIGINLIDANGFIDAPLGENASIQVAARKAISDFFETPTYTEYFDRITQDTEIETNVATVTNSDINFDFYDTSLRLVFRPTDKDFFRVNFINTDNQVNFKESALVDERDEQRESSLDQRTIAGGFHYVRNWNPNFTSEFNIYESDYKLHAINSNVLQDQRFLQENIVSETGVRAMAGNRIFKNLEWRNGYNFVETKITNLDDVDDPIFRRLEGEVLRTHAVFSEIDWSTPNNSTHLNAGVRFNYLEKFQKQIWEPRLSFNHKFLQWFNLEVLGEFKHQNTSQVINFQNDFLGIEKRRWQLTNNSDIPIIQSKQGSLGLSYERSNWLVNVVGFLKEVDGITTQSQGFLDRYELIRTSGQYDADGMDLLIRKQFRNGNTWVSYGYLKSKYRFDNLPEPVFQSNFDITHTISSGITYHIKKFHFAAGINWRTGKPYTASLAGNEIIDSEINYAEANSSRLGDYLRVDISAIYKSRLSGKKGLRAGISFWNLLNRENPINTFYRVNAQGGPQQIIQRSLGITPNATLKLLFN